MAFVTGQEVVCVDAYGKKQLTAGRTYHVLDMWKQEGVQLLTMRGDNGGEYEYYAHRFAEVQAPTARATDPATSKGKRKVNKYEQAVLDELATDKMLAHSPEALGLTGKEIALRSNHPLNCITPRFAPLRRKGLIKALEVPGEWNENLLVPRYVKRDKQIVWVLA